MKKDWDKFREVLGDDLVDRLGEIARNFGDGLRSLTAEHQNDRDAAVVLAGTAIRHAVHLLNRATGRKHADEAEQLDNLARLAAAVILQELT